MPRLDLEDFLRKTGFSLPKLASYLRVAPTYLEAVAAGQARLAARDQAACRLLWRRLFQGRQLELPFAEPPQTFTRSHAQTLARARAAAPRTAAGDRRPSRAPSPRAERKRRRAAAPQPA
jgi:hypothetical protein